MAAQTALLEWTNHETGAERTGKPKNREEGEMEV
jgi:hypothetical protein